MTIIRTTDELTCAHIRRLTRSRYEIRAIETRHLDASEVTEIIWERDDGLDAITEAEVPF
jgi:hypothetical protein